MTNRKTNVISSGIFTESSLALAVLSSGHILLHMFSYITVCGGGGSYAPLWCVCISV